ncbi:MAG TPA: SpoIIE family protein phosphatase [Candidatus Limnocylindria bacterium]|nr:SpoIIE family protein phosphatase [Candidatus Limnocylindria bacterium]
MTTPAGPDHSGRRLPALLLSAFALAVCAIPALEVIRKPADRGWAGLAYDRADTSRSSAWRPLGSKRQMPGSGSIQLMVPEGPAARAGVSKNDALLRIGGLALTDSTGLTALARSARTGDTLRYRVRRGEADREIPVVLGSACSATGFVWRAIFYLSLCLAFFFAGAFVFWKKPDDRRAWLFYLISLCLACTFALVPILSFNDIARGIEPGFEISRIRAVAFLVASIIGFVFLSMLLHFALIFPRARPVLAQRPYLVPWTYGAILVPIAWLGAGIAAFVVWARLRPLAIPLEMGLLVAAVVVTFSSLRSLGLRRAFTLRPHVLGLWVVAASFGLILVTQLMRGQSGLRPIRTLLSAVVFVPPVLAVLAALLLMPIAAIVVLVRSYRDSGAEERQQIRWPLWGLVASTAGSALVTLVSFALAAGLGESGQALVQRSIESATVLVYLFIPIGFAVGILKYRLMDLDLVIRKTAVYGVVTTLLVLLYLVVAGALGGWIVSSLKVESTWVTVAATLAVVAAFVPVRNRVQAVVDRRFFRTRYEAAPSLHRLSGALGAATDAPELGRAVIEELARTLKPRTLSVLRVEPDARTLIPLAVLGVPDDRLRSLAEGIGPEALSAVPADPIAIRGLGRPWAELAKGTRTETLVAVRKGRELLGLVLLGHKLSDEAYDAADAGYLAAAASQLAIGMSNLESPAQQRELDEARVIQAGLLPRTMPRLAGFELAAHWQPAHQVAGDYYDALPLDGGRLGLCIADVTGKGMPAALLMSNLQATVKTFAATAESPRALCERVNRIMAANLSGGRFITLFYGVLDAGRRTFSYTNAGHNPPLVLRADGSCERLEAGGLLLGAFPEASYEQGEASLAPGDRLVLYTDGMVEAENPERELFGEERLLEVLRRHARASAPELRGALVAAVAAFCEQDFQDDATLVVVAAE